MGTLRPDQQTDICMYGYYNIVQNKVNKKFFLSMFSFYFLMFLLSCQCYFLTLYFLQVENFLKLISLKFPSCRLSLVRFVKTFHSFFNKENTSAETKTKHDFSSSISDDYNILKLGKNNSQSLWCTKVFQVINATKALASVLGTKGMNIKS